MSTFRGEVTYISAKKEALIPAVLFPSKLPKIHLRYVDPLQIVLYNTYEWCLG